MSDTDVMQLRHTILNIDGKRISEDVTEVSMRSKESPLEHYGRKIRMPVQHLNMLTITFVPMYGAEGKVMVAETFKYVTNRKYQIEIVSTNTFECIDAIGILTEKTEALKGGDEWAGRHEWTFEVQSMTTKILSADEMPKAILFKDALKIAKEEL